MGATNVSEVGCSSRWPTQPKPDRPDRLQPGHCLARPGTQSRELRQSNTDELLAVGPAAPAAGEDARHRTHAEAWNLQETEQMWTEATDTCFKVAGSFEPQQYLGMVCGRPLMVTWFSECTLVTMRRSPCT